MVVYEYSKNFIHFHQQQLCLGLHISFSLHFGLVRAPLSDVCYAELMLASVYDF